MKLWPLLLLALFAGCVEDEPADTSDNATEPDAPVDDDPAAPAEVVLECTSTVGAMVVSASTNGQNVGGCALGDTSGSMTVLEVEPGPSCSIQADLDGDDLADEEATVGKTYDSGVSLTAFCEPPGIDELNRIVLQKN